MLKQCLGRLFAAVLLVAGLSGGDAVASTLTFDLRDPNGDLNNSLATRVYFDTGATASVSISSFGGNIHTGSSGIGVRGAPNGNRMGANGSTVESLSFDFTPLETQLLNAIVFETGGSPERVGLYDASNTFIRNLDVAAGQGSNEVSFDLSSDNIVGSIFFLRGTTVGNGVRISEIEVSVVPLPAALPLFLVALGGLGAVARRRKLAEMR